MRSRSLAVITALLTSSGLAAQAALAATAPSVVTAPTVTGLAASGELLTANNGVWNGDIPIDFSYQWKRCASGGSSCVTLAGATGSTYTIAPADVGYSFRVQVAADNQYGTATAVSVNTATVVTGPVAPRAQTLPQISGIAQEGQTLTTTNGVWIGSAPIAYSYSWRRCDSFGNNCSAILGATAASYLLTSADVGATIRAIVRASNAAGATSSLSQMVGRVAAAPVQPPLMLTVPLISGQTGVGYTLTTTAGSWANNPTSYAYQWQDCDSAGANCVDLLGETSSSYTLAFSDLGHTLVSKVVASNAAGSVTAFSTASPAVTNNATRPAISVYPVVAGVTRSGETLATGTGAWTQAPTSYSYSWQRCNSAGRSCQMVAGQTSSSYALSSADVGSTLRAQVTATNSIGSTTVSSTHTAVIGQGAAPPIALTLPAITGYPNSGRTLSVDSGTWANNPTSYSYQWLRCDANGSSCVAAVGSTSTSYTLTDADLGFSFRATVKAVNVDGSTLALSASTLRVQALPALPANSKLVRIDGTFFAGDTLTVKPGRWSDGYPLSYQWQRCDNAGANCVNIAGETGTSYLLLPADVGATIVVIETATNAAGAVASTSAPSGLIDTHAPIEQSPPTVSGSPLRDQTLTASTGSWANSPTVYAYQWQRCGSGGANCVDILGATSSSYLLTQADVGSTIQVTVTASNSYGSAAAVSALTVVITSQAPFIQTPPVISGTTTDGQTLTASAGSWGNSPTSYSYQWQRCDSAGANCTNILGATSSSYLLGSPDVGSKIVAVVTAINAFGSTTAASAPSAIVAGVLPLNTVLPVVSGSAIVGQVLTSDTGSWSGSTPMTFSYQWQNCDPSGSTCTNIAGATNNTYTVQLSDTNLTLRVLVVATNAAGSSAPAQSAKTAKAR